MPTIVSAQSAVELPLADQPAQMVRVLQSRTVRSGNRTFVFNRVERPVLMARPMIVAAAAQDEAAVVTLANEPARWVCRTFSGSVQGGVTELVWWDEDGGRHVVYSNVDFMLFLPWFGVRIEDTDYSALFFGMSDYGEELPQVADRQLAVAVRALARERTANYVGAQRLSEEDAELLDLLHACYAANRDELKRRAAAARVAAAAAQRTAAEEAAKPRTLVFNFWKSAPAPEATR